jgi:organic hydroperoxide reductase OsmC/OhrA
MTPLPHEYQAKVVGTAVSPFDTTCKDFPAIQVSPPTEFGGEGLDWSPEELFMASIANCLVLSFRAISSISKFDWASIECESRGVLDKVDRHIQFTKVFTKAVLVVDSDAKIEKAEQLLKKAERACFITNTLNCESFFECEILVVDSF